MKPYLTTPLLKKFKHGFFERTGAISNKEFKSLNCKFGHGDNKNKVIANRALVSQLMGINTSNLITLSQIHSPNVVKIKEIIKSDYIEADSMVTSKKGICLGILTADCAPVLFGDFEEKIIGAAHAGWKGLFNGVIENTIENMTQLGAKLENISVAIGPCIQKNNYEVGIEFYQKFIDKNSSFKNFFSINKNRKFFFDLPGSITFVLNEKGISNIHSLGKCTFAEKDKYFSHRRNQINNLGDCGRMISTIKI